MTARDATGLISAVLALSPDVRYVAVSRGGAVEMRQRAGLANASALESDRYEELLVNPTLLTLAGQRGRIDCGGLDFVLIRYGHFFQLVRPLPDGHLSLSIQPEGDPLAVAAALERALPALLGAGG